MPSGRRGPPDVKGTLGTLLRTTLEQASALRDAAWRQARSQRGWAGGVMLERQRREVLASLGELVYELAAAGELGDLEDFPEIERAIADLEAIDRDLAEQGDRREAESALDPGRPRGPAARRGRPAGRGEVRVWRPNVDDIPEPANPEEDEEASERAASGSSASKPRGARRPARRAGRRAARSGGGGIAFVDDEPSANEDDADLASYMHEDDVPDDDAR